MHTVTVPSASAQPRESWLDRSLRVFGDVRAGEGFAVIVMFANIMTLLIAYYILKTVREPLILSAGGAELKSYAAAAQAAVLMLYVPAYSWLASSVPRRKLLVIVVLFFTACIELFFLAGLGGMPYLGFAFFVWVGIFSLTVISQFWSYANDVYQRADGERLFPLIAIGSTLGAPIGAALAGLLFEAGVSAWALMQVAAVLMLAHLALYEVMIHRVTPRTPAAVKSEGAVKRSDGFALVFRSRYLLLIALLLVVLNVVNTTGEYILGRQVVDQAAAEARGNSAFDTAAYIGVFYGRYFFWVNTLTVVLQALVVSRLVKYFGMAGALFAMPIVALGSYGLLVTGAGLAITRWSKTAENATDYSAMNTAKQMLWLPTTREEKYSAKQAIDTFFVRGGDLLAAGVVFVGTWLEFSGPQFAGGNIAFIAIAFVLAIALAREYQHTSAKAPQTAPK
jgi:AAA family ATP:ADP antiporter